MPTSPTLLLALTLAAAPAAEYDRLVKNADSMVELGRLERAVDLAEQAAALSPERPESFVVWGRALASQNQLAAAAQKYERARALGSRDRRLFVELSSVYDVGKDYDRAVAVYRDWLAHAPDDAEMQQELGVTLLLLERWPEAVASLRTAARLRPDDAQVHQDLGYALLHEQNVPDASAELERAVALDPKRPEALRLLAQTRVAQDRQKDALPLLDRALALEPDEPRALKLRGRVRAATGDAAGALTDFQAVLTKAPNDPGSLLGAAGALCALDRPAEAKPLVARARTKAGDTPEVRFREAQVAWRSGDRKALATLKTLATQRPDAREVWQELALAAKKLGDAKLAAEASSHLR